MVEVAACIVTYRSNIERLRQAVESFHAQPLNTHLSIVDNDSGADYIIQLRDLPDTSVVESGANNGFGFGHNIGIRQAPEHRYYLVMNPDVVLHENCLPNMIAYMDENPDIGLLVPKVVFPDGSLQYLTKRLPTVFDLFVRRFLPASIRNINAIKRKRDAFEMRDSGYDKPVDVPFASGCFMLLRAETLRRVGGFDEGFFMYLEDCDITRRVAEHERAVFYPGAVITHHWSRGSHKSWRLTWVMIRSMVHYFNKWGWKWL